MLRKWEQLPEYMRNEDVRKYYDIVKKKKLSLVAKRVFDFIVALLMLIMLSPVFIVVAVMIKVDSKGPVMFRQVRITQYGREFRIFKFRTMVNNAAELGSQVTTKNDMRVTKVGKKIRGCRLDELPQLINVLLGDMTFVGTRPEVPKYVKEYTDEMYATLLLPAGITSECSIRYKDEDKLLADAENADEVYVKKVLPQKMKYNLKSIERFSFFRDIATMVNTVLAVLK